MGISERKPIPIPDWIDKDPDEWPLAIRRSYTLMAIAAERRLQVEIQQKKDGITDE